MTEKKENLTLVQVVITIMSVIVFFYRLVVLAIPMFTNGLVQKNYRDVALSFTMLV